MNLPPLFYKYKNTISDNLPELIFQFDFNINTNLFDGTQLYFSHRNAKYYKNFKPIILEFIR